MIQFINENKTGPDLQKRKLSQWIKSTAQVYNKKAGDISYIFCSEERILEINQQYLDHNYFTDIITFDYSETTLFPAIFLLVLTL